MPKLVLLFCGRSTRFRTRPRLTLYCYLLQLMLAESGRGIVEVQDGSRRLDDVPGGVRTAEAVIPRQTEVLVASAAIRQLKHLTGNHRLLLGHTEEEGVATKESSAC